MENGHSVEGSVCVDALGKFHDDVVVPGEDGWGNGRRRAEGVYWFSVNGKFAFEGLAWLRDRANR
jgi:hypothetical protein